MAATYRVLLTDRAWPSLDLEKQILGEASAELIEATSDDEETLLALASDADAIATCWAKVTGRVIEAAKKCRLVARLGIGLDNIEIPTATRFRIPVTNVPDYCIPEVADHTLGLLLALSRKIAYFDREAKHRRYDLPSAGPMYRLENRTLGLIGFGRIARAVRERAIAFGLNVVAYSPSGNDYGTGCPMVTMREIAKTSDYISVHAPSSEKTRHLLNQTFFSSTKRGCMIVNTSRGGLIDHHALWDAIQAGQVGGAGLDVFDPEPPHLEDPLFQDDRVIVTPHAAFTSEESLTDLRTRVCLQIVSVLNGEKPENIVNPEIYE